MIKSRRSRLFQGTLSLLITLSISAPPLLMTTARSHAVSCQSATRTLTAIQNKMVKQRRQEKSIRKQLASVRNDFATAQNQRKKWERSARKYKCNRSGADHKRCAKAEKEVRFWKKQMRKLQREEDKLLRRQSRSGYKSALAKEARAEKVRKASCSGLPAPKRPTTTAQERLAREIAIGTAIGIIGGIISNRSRGAGSLGSNCHRNPNTGLMHCK